MQPERISVPISGADQFGITISTTAVTFSGSFTIPNGCNEAIIVASGQDVRVTFDGSAPTATRGYLLDTDVTAGYLFTRKILDSMKAISVTSNAFLDVFYRRWE